MRVEWQQTDVHVHPAGALRGNPTLPGSKSLTNRLLTCAALADGLSELHGASRADDAEQMLTGLAQMGVAIERDANNDYLRIHGCRGYLPADGSEINVGHAGTAMRFLTALACLGHGHFHLDGSARMRARPIGPLVTSLQKLGAGIGYADIPGYPPVTMMANGLIGGRIQLDSPASSQFLSALLMVAPYARNDVYIAVDGQLPSRPYVDMTIDVMRRLGVEVLATDAPRFVVPAGQRYQAGQYDVEPDASAATYFWTAAAITSGCVRVSGLTRQSRQGDVHFVNILEQMNCTVREGPDYLEVAGPRSGTLRGVTVDLNEMPDTAQTLAVAALYADGPTRIENVANLRIKGTDRLAALAAELQRLGARVDVRDDGLTIHPVSDLRPAEIETYDDHRMAMSFTLAGLVTEGVVIKNAGCVSKSFPNFFEVLAGL
ncbi:MAG: 3-phosphoshikimate 1-carboxyvinyltransferase [Planctomycetota bacterium]